MRLPLLAALALGSLPPARPAQTPDLKIVTRVTAGRAASPSTTTQYVKGERSRTERELGGHRLVTINQCDQRRVIQLDPDARQYASYLLNAQGRPASGPLVSPVPMQIVPSGGTLVVNVETTDTGERKQLFGFTARHIITKQTMIPGPGAVATPQEIVRDGWYIDLNVNIGCYRPPAGAVGVLVGGSGSTIKQDKVEIHRKGAPEAGFAILLKITNDSAARGRASSGGSTTEVIELSTNPLDPALFDVPAGFRKVDRLQDYIAAASLSPQQPSAWQTIKRYWAAMFR